MANFAVISARDDIDSPLPMPGEHHRFAGIPTFSRALFVMLAVGLLEPALWGYGQQSVEPIRQVLKQMAQPSTGPVGSGQAAV
ncbi:MAG: hypothetical protein ACRDTN_04605, partial [Mycobacterium sp.]